MYQFIEGLVGPDNADLVFYSAIVLAALIVVFVLYMLFRLITRPRFAGGRRSKHARLAITDAAAVDERRKLVLVRRDDVEHLVMIGGATDMVIESDIRRNAAARPLTQPGAAAQAPAHSAPARAPAPAPSKAATPAAQAPTTTAPATQTPAAPTPGPAAVAPPTPPVAKPAPEPVVATPAPTAPSVAPAVAAVAASGVTVAATNASATIKSAVDDAVEPARESPLVEDIDVLLSEIERNK